MRFQSVQLEAYLTDGLWLRLAERANEAMARLAAGLDKLGVELVNEPAVNMVFARLDRAAIDRMEEAGLRFYRMGGGTIRLVTSFQTSDADVDEVLARVEGALPS